MAGQLEKGRKIGPYEIKDSLGKGGMASVYRAYQASLERDVAIKVMAEQFATDANFAERFRREAKSIAKLRHPNILTVYDIGEDNNLLYIAMEVIEGETLRDEMHGKPLPIEKTLNYIKQVADALNYANKSGIIHRDIKPSNVLIDKHNGRAVLSDFGIAKLAEASTNQLTATGLGVGTPDYMSPEQAQGEAIDARSDQYSLAVMTYEMLTGRTPYAGDTPIAVVMGHISKPLPSPRLYNPEIPVSIEHVLQKALAKRREDRFDTTADFNTALQKAWQDRHKAASSAEEATQVLNTHQGIQPPPGQYGAPVQGQYPGTPPSGQFGAPTQPPYGTSQAGQFGAPPQYGTHPSGQFGAPVQGQYPGTPPPVQYGGTPPPGQYGTPVPGQYTPPPQSGQFGAPQQNYQQATQAQAYAQPKPGVQPNASPAKKPNIAAIIGTVAVVLLTGVAAAFLFSGEGTKKNSTPTAAPIAVATARATATTAAPAPTAATAPTNPPQPTKGNPPTEPPPGPGAPGKFVNYKASSGLWSIDVPEGWTPEEEPGGTAFNAPNLPGLGMYVVAENAAEAGNVTPDALSELFVRQFMNTGQGKIDRTFKRKVDGVEATIHEGTFTQGGTVDLRIMTMVKNENFYAVIVSVPTGPTAPPGKDRDVLVDRLINSFKGR